MISIQGAPALPSEFFRISCPISLESYAMMNSSKKTRQQETEEWLMALGLLLILFMVMSIISVVGLLLLFLLKGEKAQKIVFYFMALLGMFIAWMTATSYATNQIKEQMISWGFGALAVVAVLVRLCGKSKNAALAAKLLAAASVVLGMVALFIG